MKVTCRSSSYHRAAIVASVLFIVLPSFASNAVCELGQDCHRKASNNAWIKSIGNETVVVLVPPTMPQVDIHAEDNDDSTTTSSTGSDLGLNNAIQSLENYLENPSQYLQDMDMDDGEVLSPNNNLLEVLDDLEEQLHDTSAARPPHAAAQEFYSRGGWQLLATLVSPLVHSNINSNNNNMDDLVVDKILAIRAAAVAALGTAVKNIQDEKEFHPWVLEEIKIMNNDDDDSASTSTSTGTTTITTPLDLVVQALVEVNGAAQVPGSYCSQSTLYFQENLAKEAIRALKIFLYGNHQAQIYFVTMENNEKTTGGYYGGAAAKSLGHQAAIWAHEAAITAAEISSNAPMSRHAIEMTRSLLSLANDIVVQDTQDDTNNNNNNVINVFSTSDWCQAAMQAATLTPSSDFKRLVFTVLQETALQFLATLGSHCFNNMNVTDLKRLQGQLTTTTTTMNNNNNNNSNSNNRNNLRIHKKDSASHMQSIIQLVEEALLNAVAKAV